MSDEPEQHYSSSSDSTEAEVAPDPTQLTFREKIPVFVGVFSWFGFVFALLIWGHPIVAGIVLGVTLLAMFIVDGYLWWELWDRTDS